MLAGAHPQPRSDRILARLIDLGVWALLLVATAARAGRDYSRLTDTAGEALPLSFARWLPVLAVVVIVAYEIGALRIRPPSLGKRLFALRVESASGGPVTFRQAVLRVAPVMVVAVVFSVSLFTTIVLWWLTLILSTSLSVLGFVLVLLDRTTPWDRLAGTVVVAAPSAARDRPAAAE